MDNSLKTSPIKHKIDVAIPVTFNLGLECTGENLIADIFYIGGSLVANINTNVVVGGAKGTEVTMVLDFSSIPIGSNYSLVISTEETGLINKGPIVILAEDGYSDEELDGSSPTVTLPVVGTPTDKIAMFDEDGRLKGTNDLTFIDTIWRFQNRNVQDINTLTVDGNITTPEINGVPLVSNGSSTRVLTEAGTYETIGGGDVFQASSNDTWSLKQSLSYPGIGRPGLTKMTESSFVFWDAGLRELKYFNITDTSFVQQGNSYTPPASVGEFALTALSETRVVLIVEDIINTLDFDGTDFNITGTPTTISSIPGLIATTQYSVCKLSSTKIAIADAGNQAIFALDFDGTDWEMIGNPFVILGLLVPAITELSSTRIALINYNSESLTTYEYDNGFSASVNWTQIGNQRNLGGASAEFASISLLSTNRIITTSNSSDFIFSFEFDGTDWNSSNNEGVIIISGSGVPSIISLSHNKYLFIGSLLEEFRLYSYGNAGKVPIWEDDGLLSVTEELKIHTDLVEAKKHFSMPNPSPPSNSNDPGVEGTISWDTNYFYVCVAADTWKRVSLSTW